MYRGSNKGGRRLPPFTRETASQKIRIAEDSWNSRNPEKVAAAYTVNSRWRNRAEFPAGRTQIVEFLRRKWAKELEYRLIKELWAFDGNRIAVRFAYEWCDVEATGSVPYGNENGEFDGCELMQVTSCEYQRSCDRGAGAPVSLATWTSSHRISGIERSRFVI